MPNPQVEAPTGLGSLRAFTNESNIFCAIISILTIISTIKSIKNKNHEMSATLRIFQLISTTTVFLTFTVVLILLNPMLAIKTGNWLTLFSGKMFFTHLFNPLCAIVSFLFLTPSSKKFTKKEVFLPLIPVILYGIIYFTNVVIFKTWSDFYNFTFGSKYYLVPFVFITATALTYGLTTILISSSNKISSESPKKTEKH